MSWKNILKARSKLGMTDLKRIHELMSDGKWRTAAEISEKLDLGKTGRVAAYMLRWTADNLTLSAKHIKRRRRKDKYITEARGKDSRGRPLNVIRWIGDE